MAIARSLVLYEPTESSPEVTTAAGFLAGYSSRTRAAYTLDLGQFVKWCDEHRHLHPGHVRRRLQPG